MSVKQKFLGRTDLYGDVRRKILSHLNEYDVELLICAHKSPSKNKRYRGAGLIKYAVRHGYFDIINWCIKNSPVQKEELRKMFLLVVDGGCSHELSVKIFSRFMPPEDLPIYFRKAVCQNNVSLVRYLRKQGYQWDSVCSKHMEYKWLFEMRGEDARRMVGYARSAGFIDF